MTTKNTKTQSRKAWTLRRESDGSHSVLRGGIPCGSVSIHRSGSGYVDWTLGVGLVPSKTTQRRLIAEIQEVAK